MISPSSATTRDISWRSFGLGLPCRTMISASFIALPAALIGAAAVSTPLYHSLRWMISLPIPRTSINLSRSPSFTHHNVTLWTRADF